MRYGDLDTLVTIQHKVTTQEPVYGTDVVTWEPLPNAPQAYAQVQDVLPSRDEGVLSGVLEVSKRRTRIRMPWRADIDSSMRLVISRPRPRTLQIIGGPADIGKRMTFIELMCEEVSTEQA